MNYSTLAVHPAINKSWLAEELYGSRDVKYRVRLYKRLHGKTEWKESELLKLEVIFKALFEAK